MSRPTISLALIAKNEEKNINRLLDSVKDCFDEIVLVDTGSTDKTKEIATLRGCKVFDFEWVNSFCKARNFAFSKTTSDYVMWLDLDDVLQNREGFIQWRDHAMQFGEFFFATYNYALDEQGKPIISFVRERVFKKTINPTWKYDLHEGIIAEPQWLKDYAISWSVNHLRDAEDIQADKSRNIKILEEMKSQGTLDARMKFYYGKELYEAGKTNAAVVAFEDALKEERMEAHDKLLTLQYAAYACIQSADQLKDDCQPQKLEYFNKAIHFLHEGMKFDPNRAEFHCAMGDIYLKLGDLRKATPYYSAAKKCFNPKSANSPYEGAVYSFLDCYGRNPTVQLAKIYFNLGKMKEARREALEASKLYGDPEAKSILLEINRIARLVKLDNDQIETDDIVITCPPQTAYEFDEELYKTKPMGGSETALIQVAKYLKEMTKKRVIVFNMRSTDLVADSGVEYRSTAQLTEYFSKYRPQVHVAWRHNIKITNAKTYLWCHDLIAPSAEVMHNFDKILCLTEFHKNFVMAKQNVPAEKIIVTRNGITPSKFPKKLKAKNPNKIVWMSSPDRGLDRAMVVLDEVRKTHPEVELHVYYGLENLYKYGLGALAEHLKSMMAERPWVKYHGFTEQTKMYEDVSDAVVWCHPCNFIETFCITAIEMLSLKIYPVTRRLGALANTLSKAEDLGMATMLDHDCVTPEEVHKYAEAITQALDEKRWEKIEFDAEAHDWKQVTAEWIKFMDINCEPKKKEILTTEQYKEVMLA